MIIQYLDGLEIQLKKTFDLSFINKYGKVFKVFDKQSSGALCFGVEKAGKRYFLKFAGAETINYDESLNIEDAISILKFTVPKYKDLKHPLLINQIDAEEIGGGFLTVYDWFDGVSFGYPQAEMCKKFMSLPVKKKQRVFEGIMEFHAHVADCGYVAIDFNDQNTLYNFENENFAICDIDFYAKQCYMNGTGGISGDPSLMSPEECRIGGVVDEISNVYAMGATAFLFFADDDKHSREKWTLSDELYKVAKKAISEPRNQRQQTIGNLIAEWKSADSL